MDKRRVSLVVAMARNGVIGRDNGLPWHLPADLQRFKALTLGKPMVMGRRTWESLPGRLPGRRHIVVTRQRGYQAPGAEVVHSLQAALEVAQAPEVMVIGGAQLYALALPRAQRLYVTEVQAEVAGDTRFPPVDWSHWRLRERVCHPPDGRHAHGFCFLDYERVPPPD